MTSLVKAASPNASDTAIQSAVTAVLDRAYAVAYALRGPYPERAALRRTLGWIAVSGEDDPPHRPVNVFSAPYPQYEVPVTARGVTVTTRFFVASPPPSVDQMASHTMPSPGRALAPEASPVVPAGDRVILFIHGMDSSGEEALDVIPHLHTAGLALGVRYSVVCLDLPSNGCSQMIAHELAAPSPTTYPGGVLDTDPVNTPLFDFLEDFVVAFVDELETRLPTPIKSRVAGVIGGSFGGNMGLRLGRRAITPVDWLSNGIVSWSPASVSGPNIKDEIKRKGPDHCRDKWNEVEHQPCSRTVHFTEVYDTGVYNSNCEKETFESLLLELMIHGPQASMWHRPGWLCTAEYLSASRHGRQEIYNPIFRRYRWRLACEQLIFSHVGLAPTNFRRQLLIVGSDDNDVGMRIFDSTRALAATMSNTPGKLLLWSNTGHSIQDERPRSLAQAIVTFFSGTNP